MKNQQMKHVMRGALILSAASLIAKILSAIYRVPFQKLVGNTGFYVYQQIYPIYGIGMTFALSGLPVFISKLVAEQKTPLARRQVLKQSRLLLAGLSAVIFLGLQLGAGKIALAMGDGQLKPLILTVSFMFLAMPYLAVSRGYFQGTFEMVPTAISQVAEQLVRVGVILIAAYLAVKQGWSVYKMGSWAMSGALFGALAAAGVLVYFVRQQQTKLTGANATISYRYLLKRFLLEGGSICLFSAMIILLQLVDSFTVKNGLVASGVSQGLAKSLKGVYDRGQPLVQLGLVVATSFSSTLLPSLTKARQQRQITSFYRTASTMIHLSFALSVAATAGLIALIPGINRLLFGSTQGDLAIGLYLLSIIFVALISTYNSVLQSQNQYHLTTIALFLGIIVKVLLNRWATFRWGITGASAVTVMALVVTFCLIWWQSDDQLRRALVARQFMFKLVVICFVMMLLIGPSTRWLINELAAGRLLTGLLTLLAVLIGGIIFVLLATVGHLFSIREWLALPLGRRYLKFLSRK
ncbi:sugar transporter [Loigolactobacillus backii]|uniref:putative polysaccharide biosynthesis protein n=1 Tax=Loigolactobacillus backii TaxID=375175 RepID=UPI0007F0FA57|nr:polysaccharide biosynthesis protein [Loigolactobacillus backii]ANK63988.1 sugar transporter [Loigolactobacillus backii]